MKPLKIPRENAQNFLRGAHGFDRPFEDVGSALAHHGYFQIDPINVCGRMHDLILRNRVAGYAEGDLMRHLHGSNERLDGRDAVPPGVKQLEGRRPCRPLPANRRTAFEHHLPHSHVLVAFPLEAWPHLDAAMQARTKRISAWSGRLTPREKELAPRLLAEIEKRGPLSSADFDDPRAGRRVWGQSTLVKTVLQKLFFHGRLLIATRINNHRQYDLPERVLPAKVLAQKPAAKEETERWIAILKVQQFRLALLKKTEVAAAGDAIVPVEIEGCPRVWCLASDADELANCRAGDLHPPQPSIDGGCKSPALQDQDVRPAVRLLAPLDPMIYQRRLTSALWNFDYTWEVYTPPAKRVRGYYALPILSGTELVGHVDPKADRVARKIRVASRRVRGGHKVAPALKDLARWLGLR